MTRVKNQFIYFVQITDNTKFDCPASIIRFLFVRFIRMFTNMFTISIIGNAWIYFSFLEEDPDSNHHQDDSTNGSDDDVGGVAYLVGTSTSLDTLNFSETFSLGRERSAGPTDWDGPALAVPFTVDTELSAALNLQTGEGQRLLQVLRVADQVRPVVEKCFLLVVWRSDDEGPAADWILITLRTVTEDTTAVTGTGLTSPWCQKTNHQTEDTETQHHSCRLPRSVGR